MILFSCNGVLVDSAGIVAQACAAAFAKGGMPISASVYERRFDGYSVERVCRHCENSTGHAFDRDFPEAAYREIARRFAAQLQRIAHVEHALMWLRQPRCIVSEWPVRLLQYSLETAGLAPFFGPRALFSASLVSDPRLHPIANAIARMPVAPGDCILVTRSPEEVAQAAAAGTASIGFAGGRQPDEDLENRLWAAGASIVISDMRRLKMAVAFVQNAGAQFRPQTATQVAMGRY